MLEQIFLLLNGLALAIGVGMVASDRPAGWRVSVAAETSWLIWVVVSGLWGLLPSATALLVMNIRGWYLHRKNKAVTVATVLDVLTIEETPQRVLNKV